LPGGEAGRRQLAGHPDGPLNDPAQRDRVVELVEDAVAHGATVAAGGKVVDGPGFF